MMAEWYAVFPCEDQEEAEGMVTYAAIDQFVTSGFVVQRSERKAIAVPDPAERAIVRDALSAYARMHTGPVVTSCELLLADLQEEVPA